MFFQTHDYRKGDQLFCQNSDQTTLNATAECGTSQDNSIVFSAITIDIAAADQAYQRYGFIELKLVFELYDVFTTPFILAR